MEYHTFRAMSTTVTAAAEGAPAQVQAGFRLVEELVQAQERRFTRFSEHSELSALNRAAGRWFAASADLRAVVRLALELHRATGGLFDPGVLDALKRAGYDRSIERLRALDCVAIPADWPVRALPAFGRVEVDEARGAIRLPEGLRIDLGGIAKGWIAEQAARLLSRYAPACSVEAGGDLVVLGLPAGQPAWQVGLEDPQDASRDLAVLAVRSGAVATSSVLKRRWRQGEREQHHLIDPRSGAPAQSDWVSVTALAPGAAEAEVLAKAALIAGETGLDDLRARFPRAAWVCVDRSGRLWGTQNSKELLYEHV